MSLKVFVAPSKSQPVSPVFGLDNANSVAREFSALSVGISNVIKKSCRDLRHAILEGGEEAATHDRFDIQIRVAAKHFDSAVDNGFGLLIRCGWWRRRTGCLRAPV